MEKKVEKKIIKIFFIYIIYVLKYYIVFFNITESVLYWIWNINNKLNIYIINHNDEFMYIYNLILNKCVQEDWDLY